MYLPIYYVHSRYLFGMRSPNGRRPRHDRSRARISLRRRLAARNVLRRCSVRWRDGVTPPPPRATAAARAGCQAPNHRMGGGGGGAGGACGAGGHHPLASTAAERGRAHAARPATRDLITTHNHCSFLFLAERLHDLKTI